MELRTLNILSKGKVLIVDMYNTYNSPPQKKKLLKRLVLINFIITVPNIVCKKYKYLFMKFTEFFLIWFCIKQIFRSC